MTMVYHQAASTCKPHKAVWSRPGRWGMHMDHAWRVCLLPPLYSPSSTANPAWAARYPLCL